MNAALPPVGSHVIFLLSGPGAHWTYVPATPGSSLNVGIRRRFKVLAIEGGSVLLQAPDMPEPIRRHANAYGWHHAHVTLPVAMLSRRNRPNPRNL